MKKFLYQESDDSMFYHDKNLYSLNLALRLVDDSIIFEIPTRELAWIMAFTRIYPERVMAANPGTPLLACEWRQSICTLDGAHRIQKALEIGQKTMSVRFISVEQLTSCLV